MPNERLRDGFLVPDAQALDEASAGHVIFLSITLRIVIRVGGKGHVPESAA